MARKLPFIPVQDVDKTAAFAGKQYQMANVDIPRRHSNKFPLFKDAILDLLYSNFIWYGLEEHESKMLEWYLINEGRVCAIKTEFNADSATPSGIYFGRYGTDVNDVQYDFYGYPTKASCSGFNGKVFKAETPDNFQLGFDTCANFQTQFITAPLIVYVERLADELDRAYCAWQVAAETRKLGMVFQGTTKRSADLLRKVLSKISENNPYVVVEGDLQDTTETLFSPGTISGLSEYHMHFMNVWGFVLDLLGCENNSQNKRERLVVSEAEMNRSLSRYLGANRLKARKDFCDYCNKKFGTDYRVENYLASVVEEAQNDAFKYGQQEKDGEESAPTNQTETAG